MTETIESTPAPEAAAGASKKRGGGLNSMLIADLKSMAGGMGITSAGSMKKAQLVEAIKSAQSGAGTSSAGKSGGDKPRTDKPQVKKVRADKPQADKPQADPAPPEPKTGPEQTQGRNRDQGNRDQGNEQTQRSDDRNEAGEGTRRNRRRRGRDRDGANVAQNRDAPRDNQREAQRDNQRDSSRDHQRDNQRDSGRSGRGQRSEPDTTILEDDVLVPAAGILDLLDNYAFVRTSGYLPGADDVYVSMSMVRKFGLRRGDAIIGEVRQPREGERREKFNPMVRIESVNGAEPEAAKTRVDFAKLTPLYPSERLRLETDPGNLIGRVIDIAAPIGKGQRGLIVSPSKAGKTMIMQSIANSITTNNPECHLMVVLVDERPEEVTDFERSVKG